MVLQIAAHRIIVFISPYSNLRVRTEGPGLADFDKVSPLDLFRHRTLHWNFSVESLLQLCNGSVTATETPGEAFPIIPAL